ncbi:MAG: TonB family protein [Acidobacteriota bacterium]
MSTDRPHELTERNGPNHPHELDDLNFLREWREPIPRARIVVAVAGAMLYQIAAIAVVAAAFNAPPPNFAGDFRIDLNRAVVLYTPPDLIQKPPVQKELTQRDPNRGKITRDLDVRSSAPPAPLPQAPRFRAPLPAPVPTPAIPATLEPPKIEAEMAPLPPLASPGNLPQVAPPPVEKPKLAFEPVGDGGTSPRPNSNPNVKLPSSVNTIADLLRAPSGASLPPTPSGGIMIGDMDDITSLASPNAPSPGPARSNLQLLSDPAGVDFKPYLVQVLAAVRTNWLSVIPQSARMGRTGRVLVQFIINRRGGVPKLVIAESSGTAAFDRAAVAGISASYPFPPLPNTFKGDEIRLQLAFTYNPQGR